MQQTPPKAPRLKAAPPAFQFYAADFVGATVAFSPEEVGAYIRLLSHQWTSGGPLPASSAKLARICGVAADRFESMWAETLAEKFQQHDGLVWNARLEHVRAEQAAYAERQRLAGLASGAARRKKTGIEPKVVSISGRAQA